MRMKQGRTMARIRVMLGSDPGRSTVEVVNIATHTHHDTHRGKVNNWYI